MQLKPNTIAQTIHIFIIAFNGRSSENLECAGADLIDHHELSDLMRLLSTGVLVSSMILRPKCIDSKV